MARQMKDSGVQWIGMIPKDWTIERAKYTFKQTNNRGNANPILLSATQQYGMYPQSKIEGVVKVNENTDLQQFKTVHIDDFVISLRSFQGGFEHSAYEGVCSPAYQTFHAVVPVATQYFKYFFKSVNFIEAMNALTVGIREGKNINFDDFANSVIAYPSLDEQQHIAIFLDNKCSAIDNVLTKTQDSIEEYKKLKQAVITEAVTKGVRGKRPMKDSDIDWIGQIPKEWDIIASRFIIDDLCDVDHYMPESVDNGVPYIMTGDLKDYVSNIEFDKCKQISQDDYINLSKKSKSRIGDLIFARYATIGTVSYVDIDKEFVVSYSCLTVHPDKNKVSGKFLFHYFKSNAFLEDVKQYVNTNIQGNVGIDALYKTKCIVPPLDEQKEIANYLDKKCAAIDTLIEKKQQFIEELTAYKKSLIYEYVTGKKEVPA